MVFKNLVKKIAPAARSISTSSVMNSGHGSTRGIVGSNLPFPIHNRYVLLGIFIVFCGSGLALPFISLRRMILLKNQE